LGVEVEKIHFVGIGGVGTGTLAVALSEQGYQVSGSDGALYEPMKSVLSSAHIRLFEGFSAETAEAVQPDTVIIGNVVRKENPESSAWIRKGTRFISFPEAVRRYVIRDTKAVVCAGTHGKTTTTAWTSFLFQELGLRPSYLIGGVPVDLPRGCAINEGEAFIGEGDEYDSAFFDKGPKFLHYHPHCAILANIEFDHADIYRDLAHVQTSFEKLVALLPGDGLCIARHEDPVVKAVSNGAICPVQTFGMGPGAHWRVLQVRHEPDFVRFELEVAGRNQGWFSTPLFGEHNVLNIVSGIAAAVHFGASIEKIRPIVERFRGARRRQQILQMKPFTLIDDFAHHPTEVAATLKSVRQRFANGRLWAFFEPRSATARRGSHQESYPAAFDAADLVLVCTPAKVAGLAPGQGFSAQSLAESLTSSGKNARALSDADAMVALFAKEHQPGDIVVVMSNGEFGKIQEKLLASVR
jgi:UDP-N-acetylmuramate: L-alanyl-gamma-D-glutamyl-meso-diaminopimelate ligase